MKKFLPVAALALLFYTVAAAQESAWTDPGCTGQGKEQPRSPLMCYSSAALALERNAAGSEYVWTVPNDDWTKTKTAEGTVWRSRYKMPFKWIDRQLFLRVPYCGLSFAVSVNGQQVGFTQQSASPVEFDVTQYSHEDYNELEITVFETPAHRALENYPSADAGENRPMDVCVIAQPRIRVRDLVVEAGYENQSGQFNLGVVVKSHLLNGKDVRVHYELLSADGSRLASGYQDKQFRMRAEDTVRFYARIPNARAWTPDTPALYTLVVKMQQEGRYIEYTAWRVGFRTVGRDGDRLAVNGAPVEIRMAEFEPAGSGSDEARLAQLKASGVNAVRVRRPMREAFYDLCDRVGIYVCDQACVDTHPGGQSREKGGNPANDPRWSDACVDRALAMYRHSQNHPSVVMFSIADGSSNGYCFYESYLALKAVEHSRPIVYPGAGGEWNSDAVSMQDGKVVLRAAEE